MSLPRYRHHTPVKKSSRFSRLTIALTALWLAERGWKWWRVRQFFRQQPPPATSPATPPLVSILQPILSGDPTLAASLAANLRTAGPYRCEWLWLVDDNDTVALDLCQRLIAAHPAQTIRLLRTPPPDDNDWRNPKMVKLVQGAAVAQGEILCVLDDDTRLPADGISTVLPYLDQPQVGLAYGLPYYVSFQGLWSSLVATFVNANSLLTYLPPLTLTTPFTINGMFYAVRRSTLDAVGGFAGLEPVLADDFAVAQRFRAAGYTLAQTPLRHAISTQIADAEHYFSLIARWFVFPRESVLRHVSRRDRWLVQSLIVAPTTLPLALLLSALFHPTRRKLALLALGHLVNLAVAADLNARYLHHATPWQRLPLVPLVQTLLPLQVALALTKRQRITWRGHTMEVAPGGGFRLVQPRNTNT